jgi:hypothetical protein
MIDLKTFKEQIDDIVNTQVARDMRAMDATLFEVFYKRSKQSKQSPPLRSLGKLPAADVIRKFY